MTTRTDWVETAAAEIAALLDSGDSYETCGTDPRVVRRVREILASEGLATDLDARQLTVRGRA